MRSSDMRKVIAAFLLVWVSLSLLFVSNLSRHLQRQRPTPSKSPRSPVPRSLSLDGRAFCSGGTCFHRLSRGICISASEVRVCDDLPTGLPRILRFEGERVTLPVVSGECSRASGRWITGTSMLADQRFLPYHKPNPHHEAEKLIPATLLAHHHLKNSTMLYWFASPADVSDWAKGFLQAMAMEDKVEYLQLPQQHHESICFQDAILFSPPTDVRYVPSHHHNSWLRDKVLGYCSLPIVNVSAIRVPKRVLVLDRNGPRHLANKDEIVRIVSRTMKVSAVNDFAGTGSFCEQVSKVAGEEFLIVPHGSQNVNLLFAPPGARIIEVFPYLFQNDALRNYTHAAQVHVYPLLGTLPPRNFIMRFWSLLGWEMCYHWVRWCKNYSRQQPIFADIGELQSLLESFARSYTRNSNSIH
ncbi:uncharacterized protein LOC9651963 [Selaginella moellendorffii]|uniref:uncharacterized protein LOC9651963 n=1 Tax=Selaginella moellendorffii TaxID=88036 RepID=UPI000D1CFD2E|nr:uncharacterized protein LOC9651963 [Selaginella moellendorffii]|eukprot:XP_024517584.1 uncharacterized protein LOC9651963 [Selaginella moellendorffii]